MALASTIAAACALQSPETGNTSASDPGVYVPANPSVGKDAAVQSADAASDAVAATDGASTEDAVAPSADGDVFDAALDASLGNCVAETYCSKDDRIIHTPGRLFCSETVEHCPYGCLDTDAGAHCAAFDPSSCPAGAPYVSGSPCKFSFNSLCFDTKEAACDCAGCAGAQCKLKGRLKLPFKLPKKDGGWSLSQGGSEIPGSTGVTCAP